MKYFSLVVLIILVSFSCSQGTDKQVQMVSPEEMQTILDMEDTQLIDVRTEKEHSTESIPGAQNIDFNSPTFEDDILKLDKSKPVILYCTKGGRSAKCASKMIEAGFQKVYELDGGITQWKYSGFVTKQRS